MTADGVEEEAWKYLAVCVPIVVFFAPFGSFLSSHFHRQVLAFLVYFLDTLALVSDIKERPSLGLKATLLCKEFAITLLVSSVFF